MILRSKNPAFGGWNGEARILWDHSASKNSKPLLIIDGEVLGPKETALADLEVVEGSANEIDLLRRGGYIK